MDTTYDINGAFKPPAKRFADLDGPDFYPTPSWATHALIDNEDFTGTIWEPACGDGSMAEVLKLTGNLVVSTDIVDRGYGEGGVDFLTSSRRSANIVTNPPYNAAEGFLHAGLARADNKVALLLRLAFLEGARRQQSIFSQTPPSRVWVFSERITFYPAGTVRAGSGTTAYAWFVWDREAVGGTELKWFEPGYKRRGF